MKKFFVHLTSIFIILLIVYGLFLIGKDSYSELHDYQFLIVLKIKFIENKKLELIDVMRSAETFRTLRVDEAGQFCEFFELKPRSKEYKRFNQKLDRLEPENFENLIRNTFIALDLPFDVLSNLTIESKKKFLSTLFSIPCDKEFMKFRFNFNKGIKEFLENGLDEDGIWTGKLKDYRFKFSSISIKNLLNEMEDSSHSEDLKEIYMDKSSDYWIEKSFSPSFFSNSRANENFYSVLPSVISALLMSIFALVTLLTISLFFGLHLEFYLEKNSIFKKIFMATLNFYWDLPESILAIFSFIVVKNVLFIENNSILLMSLILSLIICPKIIRIVLESLKIYATNLSDTMNVGKSKLKFLINDVLPLITPYIIYHFIKVLSFTISLGLLFYLVSSSDYSFHAPHGFHDASSSLVSDIFISLTMQRQNIHLIGSVLVVLVIINLLLYCISLFVKRFISLSLVK